MTEIKRLKKDDINPAYLGLLNQFGETDISVEQSRNIFKGHKPRIYVLKIDGLLIGTITLLLKYGLDGRAMGQIEDFIVDSRYRGQGYGRQLIEHVIKKAKKFGCYKLVLNCETTLVYLYQRFGFTVWENQMRMNLETKIGE